MVKLGETTRAQVLGEQCDQIRDWRTSLEVVVSFAVATSLPGALIQLAMAVCDFQSLVDNLHDSSRMIPTSTYQPKVIGSVASCGRLQTPWLPRWVTNTINTVASSKHMSTLAIGIRIGC